MAENKLIKLVFFFHMYVWYSPSMTHGGVCAHTHLVSLSANTVYSFSGGAVPVNNCAWEEKVLVVCGSHQG